MPILNWLGRDEALKTANKTPYRLLEEVPELGYGDKTKENMIIQGDNLEALKALLPFYAGQVKCIYIDPPYNTGSAFEHYDDNLEHSTWLSMMSPRLELLKEFLREDGYIFIQIDDEEQAYLKVLCDEVLGRNNFINMISVNMKNIAGASGGGEDKRLKKNCEFIICYAKNYTFTTPLSTVYDYTEMYNVVQSYKENGKNWHYTSVLVSSGEKKYIGSTIDGDGNEIKIYRRIGAEVKSVNQIMQTDKITEKEVYYKYGNMIFEAKDAQSSIRTRVIDFKNKNSVADDVISIEYVPMSMFRKLGVIKVFYTNSSTKVVNAVYLRG